MMPEALAARKQNGASKRKRKCVRLQRNAEAKQRRRDKGKQDEENGTHVAQVAKGKLARNRWPVIFEHNLRTNMDTELGALYLLPGK